MERGVRNHIVVKNMCKGWGAGVWRSIWVVVFQVRYAPASDRIRGSSFKGVGRIGCGKGAKIAQFRIAPVLVANRAKIRMG